MTKFDSLTLWLPARGNAPDGAPAGSRHRPRVRAWQARFILLLSLLLCGLSNRSYAAADSKGTDFWLTFPGNLSTGTTLTLFITGDVATTGTVSIAGLSFTAPFTVTPGTVTSVVIPAGAELFNSDVVASNGIHVTSGQEVTVYGLNRLQYTTDAYLALPTDVLGTQYINLGYLNSELTSVMGTQFAIVGTVNGTVVTITPTVTAGARAANVPYTITLNQGQTYLLRSTAAYPSDLTGSIISSTQPISVFGSNKCANVPHNHVACDHLVEQLPPTTAWGKQFVSVPLKTRLNGDTFRFLASTNNTQVRINGTLVATLGRGQYYEQLIVGSAQITSTEPILVAQYSNGTSFDNVVSDPFMMLIPPFEQFLGSYTVTTPATGFSGNYINVVAPNAAVGTVRLDGAVVAAGNFSAIGTSGYSGAQLTVSLGVHQLTGGIYPIGAFVYGFDSFDSYGYPGGQSFAPIATVSSLALTPATGTAQTGTSYCVSATVKDQFNSPVVGVRVDFAASGANSASGFNNTDANGVATFCYTGTAAGTDNIVASIGALSRTVQVTWSIPCNLQLTTAVTNIVCGAPGAITLSVAGGIPPYTYAWTGPGGFTATTKDISGLAAGSYSVTVTNTATQCTATTSATVGTTADTTPPVVRVVAGFTAALQNGTRTILASDIDNGSTDNCGIASRTVSPSTFTCANVGQNQVTLTVTDNSGNASSQTVTVNITADATCGATVRVLYQNDEVALPFNNAIRPNLQVVNDGTTAIPYQELTLRYWLTAENYSTPTTSVNWAQMGTSLVGSRYVTLPVPYQGAFGYIEYFFQPGAGSLAAGGNSGVILSSANNQRWGDFDETDDYSYAANSTYLTTSRITAYRNGVLVGGIEPTAVAASTSFKAYAENRSAAVTTSASVWLQVGSLGNVPVPYQNLTLRYWVQPDGPSPRQYTVPFASVGSGNVQLTRGQQGNQAYVQLGFSSSLGMFYPRSSTGTIELNASQVNYQSFNQSNDYSYRPTAPLAEQPKVTVYLNGTLVYGTEPVSTSARALATSSGSAPVIGQLEAWPNPFTSYATFRFQAAHDGPVQVRIYNAMGQLVTTLYDGTAKAGQLIERDLKGEGLSSGLYTCRVTSSEGSISQRVVLTR